jgi:predicted enzyme related to lactoylglutathione lyase
VPAAATGSDVRMDMKVELVPLPVTDVDRAKAFYVDQVGFGVDVDVTPTDGLRIVQVTPPGSACSFLLSTGVKWVADMAPGSVHGVHLVVDDVAAARAEIAGRGVEVSEVEDVGGGVLYASFRDPDGNMLLLQQMPWRTGDAF